MELHPPLGSVWSPCRQKSCCQKGAGWPQPALKCLQLGAEMPEIQLSCPSRVIDRAGAGGPGHPLSVWAGHLPKTRMRRHPPAVDSSQDYLHWYCSQWEFNYFMKFITSCKSSYAGNCLTKQISWGSTGAASLPMLSALGRHPRTSRMTRGAAGTLMGFLGQMLAKVSVFWAS